MPFPETFLEELAARSDIVDVVSGYVQLTKRSGSNQFGLCPFHSEKTPSFSVNSEKQIFHCFGCGKGGSVFQFIMDAENLSFGDAVQFLARRAGMEVPDDGHDANRGRRSRMLELNRDAARFFHQQLLAPSGQPAQDYVRRRGIVPMVKPFGLGYAPDSWNALTDAMRAAGYTQRELIEAGLVRAGKKGGVYDYFRNRLMFPVIDVRGSVIGFSGRIIGDSEPKYLNSPDTLVYKKSQSLFALNLAKKSKLDYILLVEGNVDVVSLHQAGFDCAVASLGTSLTAEQARLLSRYTKQIVISYDSDAAGKKAAQRAIKLLEPLEMKVRVLTVPGAKDPDEFIQAHGPQAFQDIIDKSANQIEYQLDALASQQDLNDPDGRLAFLRAAAKLVASLPGSVQREVYGMRAAEKTGVTPQAFADEVERERRRNRREGSKQLDRDAQSVMRNLQPRARELHYDNPRSAVAEEGIINLLYRFPEQFTGLDITSDAFTSPFLGRVYDLLITAAREGRTVSPASLGEQFTTDEMSLFVDIIQKEDISSQIAEKAMQDHIDKLRAEAARGAEITDLRSYAQSLRQRKGYSGKHGN